MWFERLISVALFVGSSFGSLGASALATIQPGEFWGVWRPTEPLVRFVIQEGAEGRYNGKAVGRNVAGVDADFLRFDLVPVDEEQWKFQWTDNRGSSRKSDPLSLVDTNWGPALVGDYSTVNPSGGAINGNIIIWFSLTQRERPRLVPQLSSPERNESISLAPGDLRVFTSDDGLVGNAVRAMAQTSDGDLWIGTVDALNRFDGFRWDSFGPWSDPPLGDESVSSLLVDREGRLVIATKMGGIFIYEGSVFRPVASNSQLVNLWPSHLIETEDGRLWFLLDHGTKVCRLEADESLTTWLAKDLVPMKGVGFRQNVQNLAPRDANSLYLGTPTGPAVFDFEENSLRYNWTGPSPCTVWSRDDGRLVAATLNALLFGDTTISLSEAWGIGRVAKFLETRDSGLWFVADQTLFRRIGDDLLTYAVGDKLGSTINGAMEDREGNIWLSTASTGLGRFRPRLFEFHDSSRWQEGGQPRVILPDRDGSITMAAADRVIRWRAGQLDAETVDAVYYQGHPELKSANTGGVLFGYESVGRSRERPEVLYIGLALRGFHDPARRGDMESVGTPLMSRVTDESVTFYGNDSFPFGVHTGHSIGVQDSGIVWYATDQGVFRMEDGVVRHWHKESGVRVFDASCVYVDQADRVWVGSYEEGLYVIEEGEVRHLQEEEGTLNSSGVLSVLEVPDGTMWLGERRGLTRVRENAVAQLPSDVTDLNVPIHCMVEDGLGNIWFGTPTGLLMASLESLNRAVEGRSSELSISRFSSLDGMGNGTIYSSYFPAACRATDGLLYFCVQDGFVSVDPANVVTALVGPQVGVRKVYHPGAVFFERNRDRQFEGELQLPPVVQDVLLFDYFASSHSFPERIKYEHRVRELSSGWTSSGNASLAVFSGLKPGKYHFDVRAYNHNSVASPKLASVGFEILPFFHQTWTFRFLVFGATGLLILLVHGLRLRYRLRIQGLEKQVEMNAERARIARDIHDEIGSGLAQIRLMSDVNGGRLPTKAETQRMSRLARQSSDRLREVIWSLASEASSVDDLGDYFHTLVGEFFDESGVETRVIVEGGPPNREISPSTRRELVFATKGIMSNVIRHAEASLFFVEVRGTKTTLVVSFRDNGIGFDPENIPPGSLGVAMLRERIEQLGGKFELVTHVGGGTRIRISVPYAPVGKR